MKHLMATTLLCLLLCPCIAQDLIITTNGDHIPCKVLELYPLVVRYQVENGTIQVFHTIEIAAILYRAGTTITFHNKVNSTVLNHSSLSPYNQKFAGQQYLQQLHLPKGHVMVSTLLNEQLFIQLLDTSKVASKAPSPIYQCYCSENNLGHPTIPIIKDDTIQCIPSNNSSFRLIVNSSKYAQLERLLWDAYWYEYIFDFPYRLHFSKDGIRYPAPYLLELEDDYQLKSIYTLHDGRKVAELTFQTQPTSVFITCACDCPTNNPCILKQQGDNQLLCTATSDCLPAGDQASCQGCSFKRIQPSDKTFEGQIKHVEVINAY